MGVPVADPLAAGAAGALLAAQMGSPADAPGQALAQINKRVGALKQAVPGAGPAYEEGWPAAPLDRLRELPTADLLLDDALHARGTQPAGDGPSGPWLRAREAFAAAVQAQTQPDLPGDDSSTDAPAPSRSEWWRLRGQRECAHVDLAAVAEVTSVMHRAAKQVEAQTALLARQSSRQPRPPRGARLSPLATEMEKLEAMAASMAPAIDTSPLQAMRAAARARAVAEMGETPVTRAADGGVLAPLGIDEAPLASVAVHRHQRYVDSLRHADFFHLS
jgi:hypothetical protein